jgi:hypothetical protein
MTADSMRALADYHHFRADAIPARDRVARCERRVIDLLLSSQSLPDTARESSIAFELKHHHSVAQLGRILARKRGLPLDVCTVGALLHDIYVIQHGGYTDHAHLGAPLALSILRDIGGFTGHELEQVHSVVFNHSDKHVWSADSLAEFGKDADVLDCFLYPGAFDYYLRHKSLGSFAEYLKRATNVWHELGIPSDPRFRLLEGFTDGWFTRRVSVTAWLGLHTLATLEALAALGAEAPACPPPFAVKSQEKQMEFALNGSSWDAYLDQVRGSPGDIAVALGLSSFAGTRLSRLVAFDGTLTDQDVSAASSLLGLSKLQAVFGTLPGSLVVWPALGAYEHVGVSSRRAEELGL